MSEHFSGVSIAVKPKSSAVGNRPAGAAYAGIVPSAAELGSVCDPGSEMLTMASRRVEDMRRSSGLHPSQASRFIVDGALGFDQAYLHPRRLSAATRT